MSAFGGHLAVDRVQRLFATGDADLHADLREGVVDIGLHLLDQVAPATAGLGDGLGQHRLAPGVEVAEGEVLQLAVGLVQTQPVGDGGVDVEGFRGDAPPLAARHVAHGAHVVGTVGQLDQDDAHITRHGQQHLAEGFRLVFFTGVELQLVQLGQSVHQLGHLQAEAVHELRFGHAAVLERIVQQRGHQGLGVEFPDCALGRDRDRVGDVGLAAVAQLAQMGLVGKSVGLTHLLNACGTQIAQVVSEGGEAGGGCVGGGYRAYFSTGRRVLRGVGGGGRGQHRVHASNVALSMAVCDEDKKKHR